MKNSPLENSQLSLQKTSCRPKIVLIGLNARYVHSCLALFYVRNELRKRGVAGEISLYQATINDNYYELLLKISGHTPDYIFFSAAIWNSDLITRLINDLACCQPEAAVVVGGPQASVLAKHFGCRICAVFGPIEAVADRFCENLIAGQLQRQYIAKDGLPVVMASDGHDMFDFPYHEDDYSQHLANRNIYYESSRGCPFRCSYCLSAADTRVIHKSVERVGEELAHILKHHPKTLRFVDRTFNDLPQRSLEIWRYLVNFGGDTLSHFEMAPDRFTDEMFTFLRSVPLGAFQFEIGVQSTHPPTLAAIDRKVDIARTAKNIALLAEFGNIHLHVDLILGLPYETEESFAQSFRDLFAMGAHYIQMGLLKILPDTPISRQVEAFGYVYQADPPYSVLANRWLSHEQLSRLYWFCECVEKFLNNRYFVSLWQYLRRDGTDIFNFFIELLAVGNDNDLFERAPTQEFLTTLLSKCTQNRPDRALITELLCYDWLRCGFRFLPQCLQTECGHESHEQLRTRLYQRLPDQLEGVYGANNRNYFFRKSFFQRFSEEALVRLGYTGDSMEGCLCFLSERESSLYGYNRVVLV